MTGLTITPKVSDKTARFKGTIAAGEHVAVTIKGGAEWLGEDEGANLTLRLIDLVTKRTLAVFPRPAETLEENEDPDAWGSSGDDLTCTLNLNTLRMVNAARHLIRVPVLFVLGDTDAPRTLYFRDKYEVEYWPERIGDDVPYDLDAWPKQIDEWTELVEEWTAQMAAFGATLSGHVGNGGIHVTAEQKAAWTNKQDKITDLDAIRAGAAKGATAIQAHQDISGKADLVGGKVPQSQLPSYVDDVLEYASLSAFPQTGEEGKIYVAKDTNLTYRWSGTQYVQVGGGGSEITVDPALSPTSTNPVQNKVVKAAMDARPTKADVEAGWWSGWTFSGGGVRPGVVYSVTEEQLTEAVWEFTLFADGEFVTTVGASNPGYVVFTLDAGGGDITATRHRVAAPVPTKPEDIGAQPAGSYATAAQGAKADAALSRAEFEAGFTEWVFSPATFEGKVCSAAYEGDGWYLYLGGSMTEQTDPSPEDATSLSFMDGSVTATRTRLPRTSDIPTKTSELTNDSGFLTQQSLVGLMPVFPMDGVTDLQFSDWTSDWPTDDQFVVDSVEWNDTNKTWDVTFRDTEDPSYTQILSTTPNTYTADALTFTIQNQGDVVFTRYRVLTVSPFTVATYTAGSTAAFSVAVGVLPTGVTGKARDCILVIDCTAAGAVAPTVTWGSHFHPRTDAAKDLAIVEAGKRAVFYISEYAAGEFAVGGWTETAGGNS